MAVAAVAAAVVGPRFEELRSRQKRRVCDAVLDGNRRKYYYHCCCYCFQCSDYYCYWYLLLLLATTRIHARFLLLFAFDLVVVPASLDGDLDRVEKIVKLFGIVSSKDSFKEQHLVLNGASDVMMSVFEDRGYHARSAIGTNTLPLDIAVEVEAIVKVKC